MSPCAARRVVGIAVLIAGLAARPAMGETARSGREVLDRTAVRFYAPETGGTQHPRFIPERTLAFEARLEALAERPEGTGEAYQERHVRTAVEHHVAEEMLASLAHKLIDGLPAKRRPSDADLAKVEGELGAAWFERLGGRSQVEAAASAEEVDEDEIQAIVHRQGLAAWYLDRVMSPILQPTEEQLREVFRTSAHPYRGRPFDQVRNELLRWFVIERLRGTESAFFQGARTRVTIVVTP